MIQHSLQRDEGNTTGDEQKAGLAVPVIVTPVLAPVNAAGAGTVHEKILNKTVNIAKPPQAATTPAKPVIKKETVKKPKAKPALNKESDKDF